MLRSQCSRNSAYFCFALVENARHSASVREKYSQLLKCPRAVLYGAKHIGTDQQDQKRRKYHDS